MGERMIYVIEHLEPMLSKWVFLEYKHISEIVGKASLMFTNITRTNDVLRLNRLGRVEEKSVKELNLPDACILDPSARVTLSPDDAKHFKYLVFGGILGDAPMQGRTRKEITSKVNLPDRNLGKKQMSTDTAVYVARAVVSGTLLTGIRFRDNIELHLQEGLSVKLPFSYVLLGRKPMITPGLEDYLRAKKGF